LHDPLAALGQLARYYGLFEAEARQPDVDFVIDLSDPDRPAEPGDTPKES
jgi:hypothetical protein